MASKSYCWDVRNIAKISPKMAKNNHFSTFFEFLKSSPYDSNETFYSHSTPNYGFICAISSKSYGWDVRNIAEISPKMAKKQSFFDFFRFLGVGKNFRLLMQSCCFFFVFFSPDLFMKISNFSKTVHTIFTKFCTVILHPKGPLRLQRHQNRKAGM